MNRRTFLKRVGLGLAAGAGAGFIPARTFAATGWRSTPPSERVVMGIIGLGGMGNAHLNWFSGFEDVEVVALCDTDRNRLGKAHEALKKKQPGKEVKAYGDFRELLDRKDIDAVSIATPDHWHALMAIRAFETGKDVYGEKPLCHSIPEGRAMLDTLEKNRRVFQLGTQIHAGENYHRVVDLVRSGILGKVKTVRVWKAGGTPTIEEVPDEKPPLHLDWNMWIGPRPMRPYNRHRCHFNFRYFWDYSGGDFADFWCHIADIAFWALDPGAPKTVAARGELVDKGMAETHAWLDVDLEYEGLDFFWTTKPPDVPGAEGRGIGACFEGDKGSLVTDYGSRRLFIDGEEVPGGDLADVPKTVPRSPGHQRHFIDCVKTREQPESNMAYVHGMTVPMHLGIIAYFAGRKLEWNGKTERFVDDKEADILLDKNYRAPWKLPGA